MANYFISYNKADRQWAEWIAWQLQEQGHTVKIQAWDFVPGTNFVLEMQKAMIEADKTIAVLSPDYLASFFTQPEWAGMFAQDPTGAASKLIPVRVCECEPTGLLAQIIYLDLVGKAEPEARRELLDKIEGRRLCPDLPPSFPGAPGSDAVMASPLAQPVAVPATSGLRRDLRLTPPTDLERGDYIRAAFAELRQQLEQELAALQAHNPGLLCQFETVDARKWLLTCYVHGNCKTKLKAWLASDFGSTDMIKLAWGRSVSDLDGSCNEQITVEVADGQLILRPMLNLTMSRDVPRTVEAISAALLEQLIVYLR